MKNYLTEPSRIHRVILPVHRDVLVQVLSQQTKRSVIEVGWQLRGLLVSDLGLDNLTDFIISLENQLILVLGNDQDRSKEQKEGVHIGLLGVEIVQF